jgi:hypothetical protein
MADFFVAAHDIVEGWDDLKKVMLAWPNRPCNDEVFALAAELIGQERILEDSLTMSFIHMKPLINGYKTENWMDSLNYSFDGQTLVVGGHDIFVPIHYHNKDFCTDELVGRYEECLKKKNSGMT